jgi:hypothetical protein
MISGAPDDLAMPMEYENGGYFSSGSKTEVTLHPWSSMCWRMSRSYSSIGLASA